MDIRLPGTVVSGHGVASGQGRASPYPGGSLRLQAPLFRALGLDLGPCFMGTINVSTAPRRIVFSSPVHRFAAVEWTALHPPEDFSFVRCSVVHGGRTFLGWGYRPDPGTKKEHFQSPYVVEVIAGRIDGLRVGDAVVLELDAGQVTMTGPAPE